MFCLRCLGTIPNVSKYAAQKVQPQALKAVSGMPLRTNPQPTFRQSSRFLTTTTTTFARSIPSQLTRFSSPSSLLRTTSSAFPSSSPLSPATSPSSIRSFSVSPYLGAQRNTYNPSRRVQKRRHGFLARLKTRGGRKILMRRRAKGRKNMSW